MKKQILWIIMIFLMISFCACRPEGKEIDVGSSGTAAPTESAVPTEDPTEQPAENEAEQPTAEEQPAEEAEYEAATQIPEENAEQPATESTTSGYTEDPALRAEAEKIYQQKGEVEYYLFCADNGIKGYHKFVNTRPYELNRVKVSLFKGESRPGTPPPDFSCVNPIKVEETPISKGWLNWGLTEEELSNRRQNFYVYIENDTEEGIVQAVKELEKLDYVQEVTPIYIYENGGIVEE